MKKFILALFLLSCSGEVLSKNFDLPDSIPSGNTILRRTFSTFMPYMSRLFKASDQYYLTPDCLQLQYYKSNPTSNRTIIDICVDRVMTEGEIKEVVSYQINGQFAGRYSVIRHGMDLVPFLNRKLMMMQPYPVKKNQSLLLEFPAIGPTINIEKSESRSLAVMTFPHADFKLSIEDIKTEDQQVRVLQSRCKFCGREPKLTVIGRKSPHSWIDVELSYYSSDYVGRVTPRYFESTLGSYIFRPFGQIGSSLLLELQKNFHWPKFD